MKIIGVDPGINSTGFGIVEVNGNSFKYVSCGNIRPKNSNKIDERLKSIFDELSALIDKYNPDYMVVETTFMNKNASSALKLGHARGAAILAGATKCLQVFEYSPRQVKLALTGYGAAEKDQVKKMTEIILNIKNISSLDASDALAIAICHAQSNSLNLKVAKQFRMERVQ